MSSSQIYEWRKGIYISLLNRNIASQSQSVKEEPGRLILMCMLINIMVFLQQPSNTTDPRENKAGQSWKFYGVDSRSTKVSTKPSEN